VKPAKALVAVAVFLTMTTPGLAQAADTDCAFGGPAGTAHVARLSLPRGSDFLDLRISGTPPLTVAGDHADSHLAQGIGILDGRTGALVAARVTFWGTTTRTVVVRVNGTTVAHQELTGPAGPFQHASGTPVPSLTPGSYYAVAFGTDGDPRLPNATWGADLRVGASVSCVPVGDLETFDFDSTSFAGGTDVTGYGAGVVAGARLTISTSRRLVFGLFDAHTQVAGSARLTYSGPTGSGSVQEEIAPFASRAGALTFHADAQGPFPILEVAGVAFSP
jgi:hypothetical protein